ncbi:MAG: DUF4142 domain-containing protein [Chitinophagaceae bacterium]|nr:MAG: DUF4142 domain-containing protein [Chitinophagaceae bacterium]
MKKYSILALTCLGLFSCNNSETKTDSSQTMDSSTSAKIDTSAGSTSATTVMPVDSATARFLVKATQGGLAEVASGNVAQGRTTNEGVKMFASMMVNDHSNVNGQIQTLAQQRMVSLPTETSEENKKMMADTEKKTGKDFDRAYMDMMVAAHKKTISMFEKASGEIADSAVKDLITQTLPKVKTHLDSAQAIRRRL